jgi:hypothetical protein
MNYSQAISFINEPPRGWKKSVSLEEYAKLEEDRKKYYMALYAKYRPKKIRDYDPDTGSYVGWKTIQVGIGDPVGYEYIGFFEAHVVDQIFKSNILMQRVLGK